jgi:glycosyltransferase involved in cell wall biosynthesis
VLHVLHTVGPGGAQDLLLHLARARHPGLTLGVLALTPLTGYPLVDELRALGLRVNSARVQRAGDPRALIRTARAIAALSPDVVHTHGKHADLVGGAGAALARIPSVSTLHLIEQPPCRRARATVAAVHVARRRLAARTVTVSEAQRRWYLASCHTPAERVVTVHNGVTPPRVVSAAEREAQRAGWGAGEASVVAVALGMMRPDRGYTHLLSAAAQLQHKALRVVLVGDGPLAAQLRAQAHGLPHVVFAGYTRDPEAVLAAADLLVQPSLQDALPTSLLQGLGAGLPLVASDVGGIPEIVTAAVGELVPPAAPAPLAAALDRLAGDPGQRAALARASRDRFRAHFTAIAWAARLYSLYADVRTASEPALHHSNYHGSGNYFDLKKSCVEYRA